MSAPTQPTETTIVTEAFAQFGNSDPSSADLSRAISKGLGKVKWDIWDLAKRWRLLRTTQYLALKVGVSRYANPTDFEQDLQEPGMSILDGKSRDFCQAAGSVLMTLSGTEPAGRSDVEGHLLALLSVVGGPGVNQAEQVDDYNPTTKLATMRAAWGVTPSGSVGYLIVDSADPVSKKPWSRRESIVNLADAGKPREAFEMAAGGVGYIELQPVPDKVYMLKRDYYANLLMVDTSSTLYSTILRNWEGIFIQGVLDWLMLGLDDTRSRTVNAQYIGLLKHLRANEVDSQNESNLQTRVVD